MIILLNGFTIKKKQYNKENIFTEILSGINNGDFQAMAVILNTAIKILDANNIDIELHINIYRHIFTVRLYFLYIRYKMINKEKSVIQIIKER
jgi:hypothetical protein